MILKDIKVSGTRTIEADYVSGGFLKEQVTLGEQLALIVPYLNPLVRTPIAQSHLLLNPSLISSARSRGLQYFPWHPKVDPYEGHVVYSLNDQGLVAIQSQTWSISPVEALRETFTPTFGPRSPVLQ